jgi:serine protease Do
VDSDTLEVGDIVFAIGNPFGFDQTVTSGIVSALARTTVGVSDYQFFIQTDAAINPGNSGGALINMDGKLVGINTAIYTRSGGSNGIGFATPSNMVAAVVNSKIENNRVIRPWLGMKMQRVTQEIASSLSMDRPSGVLVAQLYPGGAAEKAGIEVGDVILKVANNEVSDRRIVNFRVAMHRLGSSVPFDILRNGKKKTLLVKMLPPVEEPKRDVRILKGNHPLANTKVANLSPALADELEVGYLSNGVVVLSKEKRIFSRGFGIRSLDIIRSINDKKVNSTRDLERLVKELEVNTSWKLSIERGGKIINMVWRR